MNRRDMGFEDALSAAIDGKTKPPGSLGRIEELAAQVARLQHTLTPRMETCRHIVFAADHGIAASGVSAFPQSVTRQMVENLASGGAAANVLARSLGIPVDVVDAGVIGGPPDAGPVIDAHMGPGTANALEGPAMAASQVDAGLARGRRFGREAGSDALSLGEMGIGNTSAAALVAAKLIGRPVAELAGPGTGLAGDRLEEKRAILTRAASRTDPVLAPEAALAEYGGFEIVMMTGAMLGAAEAGRLVLVDGFIATAAAAAALGLDPSVRGAMVFSHKSAEPGHGVLCDAIDAQPLLQLDLRLGEGTGALLAWPLVRGAAAILNEMASFESAGVDGAL